MNMAKDQFV